MTSLQPRAEYTDAELARLYPRHLRLVQVHVLLRHGERTPTAPRFANAGLHAFWPYCSSAGRLRAAVLDPSTGGFSQLQWRRRLETFGSVDDDAVLASGPPGGRGSDSLCDRGMLTDRGRETTHALGARLRRLYVDRLGFLPASLGAEEQQGPAWLYLRSTAIPRALESVQQAFHGLYPRAAGPVSVVSRAYAEETLLPNDASCRRFAELSRAFAQRAADRWNGSDEMAYVSRKIGKWMPDGVAGIDSKPRLSGIMDTINATAAHGPDTRLPPEFYDPKLKRLVEKMVVDEWFAGYAESREYRALGIGALLGDVVARMVRGASSSTPLRLALSGCHDTSIAAVLASLGAYPTDAWPPFTSHVSLELFRSANLPPSSSRAPAIGRTPTPGLSHDQMASLKGHYVRVRYNDEPVVVPGCKARGNHLDGDESFCTLEAFKAIVDKFTPRNWSQECIANLKSAAFPTEIEPAGL